MTKPFLRDPQKQQEYQSKGYVVIPFLDRAELAELKQFYASLRFASARQNLCSVIDERPTVARQMKEVFTTVAAEAIARNFRQCELLHGNFLVKQPGQDSVTRPHQDWTIVDGPQDSVGAAWMPLEDVDIHNGAMGAIPGSRSVFPDICCAPSA